MISGVNERISVDARHIRLLFITFVLKMLGNKIINSCNLCSRDADYSLQLGAKGGFNTSFFVCKNHYYILKKLKGDRMIDAICQVVKKY
jgi:hypothetical protein